MDSCQVTIKNATVKAITYQNIDEMKQDLNKFLIFYNFNRGHGGLRKEIIFVCNFITLEAWAKVIFVSRQNKTIKKKRENKCL
jgi:DNA-binding transcriptional regulator/RsmH inhibitor MraZ